MDKAKSITTALEAVKKTIFEFRDNKPPFVIEARMTIHQMIAILDEYFLGAKVIKKSALVKVLKKKGYL